MRRGHKDKGSTIVVSSLATADALTKLSIEKGMITEAEFMQKLSAESGNYQALFVRKVDP